MVAIPLTLEGAALQTAYTISPTTTPEVPNPPFAVGTMALGTDASVWVFVKLAASQTIAAGDFVYVNSTDAVSWNVTSLSNTAKALLGALVGIAGAAATSGTTSTQYIWIMRAGHYASANVITSASANALLYTSATAGRLTGTASATNNSLVSGVVPLVTAASNLANVALNFPAISTAQ
jgi:hypothetical protein